MTSKRSVSSTSQRFEAIFGDDDIVPLDLEQPDRDLAIDRAVFDEQDPQRLTAGRTAVGVIGGRCIRERIGCRDERLDQLRMLRRFGEALKLAQFGLVRHSLPLDGGHEHDDRALIELWYATEFIDDAPRVGRLRIDDSDIDPLPLCDRRSADGGGGPRAFGQNRFDA